MTQVGCGLSGLLSEHERVGVDGTECVNDNLTLHGLDGIDDDGNGTGGELFEGLLGIDIDTREPTTKTRM